MKSQEEVCPLRQTFFGLNSEYKLELHDLLVTLCMNVKGFAYETWYNMPVHLRNHYTSVIKKKTDEQNKKSQQEVQRTKHFSNIKGAK